MAGAALPLDRFRFAASSHLIWAAALTVLVLFTRIGSLVHEVIDWDESTFILMAADVLHGRLPYVHLYDNKPPFMFFALAGVMMLFGESLFVVRLFGDYCVALTSILTFCAAARFTGATAAGLGACVFVAASSVVGQWTQTEHVAMALVMGALFILLRWRRWWWSAAAAGALMSLAALTRSNLIFVVICLGLFYLWRAILRRPSVHPLSVLAYIGGGLTPLAALFGVYAHAGRLDVLWLALIETPIAYAADQGGLWATLRLHFWFVRQFVFTWAPLVFIPLIVLSVWGLWAFVGRLRQPEGPREELIAVGSMFVGALVSLVFGGAAYPHYWNQIFPFLAILIAMGVSAQPLRRLASLAQVGLCILALGQILVQYGPETMRVLSTRGAVEADHKIRQAAVLIDADRAPGDRVWALNHHLVLWYLDLAPVSPAATHPDNLVRSPIIQTLTRARYVPDGEFERVLASEPRYVVTGPTVTPDYLQGAEAMRYENWLAARYELWRSAPPVLIYRRKAAQGAALRGRLSDEPP